MKPVFQAVLFLGLVTPSFSATPVVDFDGTGEKSINVSQELKSNTLEMSISEPSQGILPDGVSVEVAFKSTDGKWVVQKPERIEEKAQYYTFLPDTEIRATYSCTSSNPDPNLNYWQVSVKHTNFPSNAGHVNHPTVPGLQTPVGANLPNPIISKKPVNTPFVYYWKIPSRQEEPFLPAYASKISHDATYSYACSGVNTMIVEMKVPNLVELAAGTGYDLVGADPNLHPRNHFGTPAMNKALKELAIAYNGACPGAAKLSYNDMSLIWGGLYDVKGNWKPPHREHRFGINIDVGKRQVKKANRKKLIEMMCDAGYAVLSEGDASGEVAHYHLELGAAKGWGRAIKFDTDSKATPCCPGDKGIPVECISLYDNGVIIEEPETPSNCN